MIRVTALVATVGMSACRSSADQGPDGVPAEEDRAAGGDMNHDSGGVNSAGGGGGGGGGRGGGDLCGGRYPSTFADGPTATKTLFVAPGGNGNGSASSPFGDIEAAAAAATPGTEIVVRAGTYAGGMFISQLRGTAMAPIWLRGEGDVFIDGGSNGIQLEQARYLILEGFHFRNQTSNGLNIDDGGAYDDPDAARYVLLRDITVRDTAGPGNHDCIKMSGLDDFFVFDADLRGCPGQGIDMVGCHDGFVVGNRFEDLTGSAAVQTKGGSDNVEIRGNAFSNAGARTINLGGSTGFAFFRPPLSEATVNAEARNIRVIANHFVGSDAPFAFVGCDDCLVSNNTIEDPTQWVLRILQETMSTRSYEFAPARNGRVMNNIFHVDAGMLSSGFINVGMNTDAPSFTFSHNLWYAYAGNWDVPAQLPSPETGGLYEQEPTLVAGGRFLDNIAGVTVPEVSVDYDGTCYGQPPNRGLNARVE
ncbi:MAG: right-handed parallel beta-helix repeat-containing protein [Myxococcota bacterium]